MTPTLHLVEFAGVGEAGPTARPVDLDLAAGTLGVVVGPAGSGRSSLLLAAAGRFRRVQGEGTLAGHDLRTRPARARAAVARIAGLVDLEPRLTVEESIVERALVEGIRTADADPKTRRIEHLLDTEFPRDRLVEDLTQLDRSRLALALSCLRAADLIVFDDVDRGLDPQDQRRLFADLATVAGAGPAVLAATTTAETVPPQALLVNLAHPTVSPPPPAPARASTLVPPVDHEPDHAPEHAAENQDPANQDPANQDPANQDPAN